MAASGLITLSKGGTEEKTVKVGSISIPDLWPVIERLGYETADGKKVDRCWHLCHDLLNYINDELLEGTDNVKGRGIRKQDKR
jgi:hypothetical protein